MDHAGRIWLIFLRPFQPQKPIGLDLESRCGDRPEPGAAPQAFAAHRRIDEGWAGDRRRPIEAFQTLDRRDLFKTLRSGPSIDRRRLIAGIHGEFGNRHHRAIGMLPCAAEHAAPPFALRCDTAINNPVSASASRPS